VAKLTAQKIRVKLRSFDAKLLDQSAAKIVVTTNRSGAKVAGPIPLPSRIEKFCVLRSPHVNKKSREQFEIRTHMRLIDIIDPNEDTIEALMKLELPAGISVDIKS
jgi:small subunit ribosomal protein S10